MPTLKDLYESLGNGSLMKTRDNRVVPRNGQTLLATEEEGDEYEPEYSAETKIFRTWTEGDLEAYNTVRQGAVDGLLVVASEKVEYVPSQEGWIIFLSWRNQVFAPK